MVDVLINYLLKSKELEIATSGPGAAGSSGGGAVAIEDSAHWRSIYEHPLTAATTAMLNINEQELQQENFKERATFVNSSAMANGQCNSSGAVMSPQAGEILREIRRISDGNELNTIELEAYLNRNFSGKKGEIKFRSGIGVGIPDELSPKRGQSLSPDSAELPPASTVLAHVFGQDYGEALAQYTPPPPPPPQYPNTTTSAFSVASPPEYQEYDPEQFHHDASPYSDAAAFVDRYMRCYPTATLPSPDSGIGDTAVINFTPQILSYPSDLSLLADQTATTNNSNNASASTISRPASSQSCSSMRSWNDFGRSTEPDKIQIFKVYSEVGFRYILETPISTSHKRVDDRISYINKGQFYGITLEYIPDHARPLLCTSVRTVIMLMFREEKPADEELKAWQFWHSRQHSVKQRILDADTKNSSGIIGQIEEITHNAIAFYWNPLESPAKVNIAVQCLSTDFSNQKGVKGLPLHIQIDTFDEFRENSIPRHRGYCQIKVFCDKGAERKTRDEERRAVKRKLVATGNGRKKLDEMYHLPCDRSEFYSMSDLLRPPVLFTPTEFLDKGTSMDLNFYGSQSLIADDVSVSGRDGDSRSSSTFTPPIKRSKPNCNDRVLLYAREEKTNVFQPLHLRPPTLVNLAEAIKEKFGDRTMDIRNIYKKNKKGIVMKMDDDILKDYCNEDLFILETTKVDNTVYDITLVEL